MLNFMQNVGLLEKISCQPLGNGLRTSVLFSELKIAYELIACFQLTCDNHGGSFDIKCLFFFKVRNVTCRHYEPRWFSMGLGFCRSLKLSDLGLRQMYWITRFLNSVKPSFMACLIGEDEPQREEGQLLSIRNKVTEMNETLLQLMRRSTHKDGQ